MTSAGCDDLKLLADDMLWSLWDMLRFGVEQYLHLSKEIGRLSNVLDNHNEDEIRPPENKKNDIKQLNFWIGQFDELNLKMCAQHAYRIRERCKDKGKPLYHREMGVLIRELGNRLEDECRLRRFLHLRDEAWKLYQPSEPLFGIDVENKIPSIIEDIAEAGKCLGLGRPTASVFHLMRVMEVGVQQMGDALGVSLTDEKVWQVILDGINAKIKAMGKADKAKLYASASSHLFNVKLAWRNEAMHPKATYTIEEAEGIFSAVRYFMKDLVLLI